MMTFRVSHVEAFRRYQQEEDAKLEDLLANIRAELLAEALSKENRNE